MTKAMILQGREVSAADIELIRSLIDAHPTRGRTPLSRDLCRRWNWRNAQGRIKVPIKDVYLYSLIKDFKTQLSVVSSTENLLTLACKEGERTESVGS